MSFIFSIFSHFTLDLSYLGCTRILKLTHKIFLDFSVTSLDLAHDIFMFTYLNVSWFESNLEFLLHNLDVFLVEVFGSPSRFLNSEFQIFLAQKLNRLYLLFVLILLEQFHRFDSLICFTAQFTFCSLHFMAQIFSLLAVTVDFSITFLKHLAHVEHLVLHFTNFRFSL